MFDKPLSTSCAGAIILPASQRAIERLRALYTSDFGTILLPSLAFLEPAKKSIFIQIYVYFTAILGTDSIVADFIAI